MCNQYATGFNFGQSGCGCNSYGYTPYGCGNGGESRQTICRDCCGNIRVTQHVGHCCGCHHTCCCNGTNGNGTTTQNGNGQTNGRFTCLTFCGVNNNPTTANAGDLYYARQYGLPPFGYNRGCGCTLDTFNET